MNVQILPTTTVEEIAKILDENRGRDVETYVRVETIRGKPVAYLVREPRIPLTQPIALLRTQAE